MQHVIRLCGSRLQARTIRQISHGRSFSTSASVREDDHKSDRTIGRTLRPRKHGNSALTVSALFDPITVAAREKHKEPKALPPQDPSDLTDFQRELAQNVYALALATPIRYCVLTKARLPAHFLVPFVTNMPPKEDNTNGRTQTDSDPDRPLRRQPTLAPRIGFSSGHSDRPSSYILATRLAISSLSGKRVKKQNRGSKWAMLVNERMKRPWAVRSKKHMDNIIVSKDWEWDDDMPDVVKRLLGREVVRRVEWCAAQEGCLIGEKEEVEVGERAALLNLGGSTETADVGVDAYNLSDMLDDEQLADLRGLKHGVEELAIRRHSKTAGVHLALEAIRNYVTKH